MPPDQMPAFDETLAEAISQIWNDPSIQVRLTHKHFHDYVWGM